jgi:hypothetical protein
LASVAETVSSKSKSFLFPTESLDNMLAKTSQASTPREIQQFRKSISNIDTTNIETYADLSK